MTYRRYGISINNFNMNFVKFIVTFRDPRENYYRCYYLAQDPHRKVSVSEQKQHGHHQSSSEILQHPTSSDPSLRDHLYTTNHFLQLYDFLRNQPMDFCDIKTSSLFIEIIFQRVTFSSPTFFFDVSSSISKVIFNNITELSSIFPASIFTSASNFTSDKTFINRQKFEPRRATPMQN